MVGWQIVGTGSSVATGTLPLIDTAPVSSQTFVAANDADFSWVHQGEATVTVDETVFLRAPGTQDRYLATRVKPAPQAPYSVRVALQVAVLDGGRQFGGVCWRNSETERIATFGILGSSSGCLTVDQWSDPVTFLTNDFLVGKPFVSVLWLELIDDGTSRSVGYSVDGKNFLGFHLMSESFDQIGYCAQANAVCDVGLTVLSWEEK